MTQQFAGGVAQFCKKASRLAIDRNGEIARRRPPALDFGLVVAGEKAHFLAKPRDPHGTEVFLEKAPRRGCISRWIKFVQSLADLPQRLFEMPAEHRAGFFLQDRLTTVAERLECRDMIF